MPNMNVTESIGIPIDLDNGIFTNTVNVDGVLQLKELSTDDLGRTIYAKSGIWESFSIDIVHKIQAFEHVAQVTVPNGGSVKIYTKSSNDNLVWSDYEEIDSVDFSIVSPTGRFARVKIELFGEMDDAEFTIDEFDNESQYDNKYIKNGTGVLGLKKDYSYLMTKEAFGEEFIFRKKFNTNEFRKIDKISVGLE